MFSPACVVVHKCPLFAHFLLGRPSKRLSRRLVYKLGTGGGQKKVATHKKWVTWFIMAIDEENVNKSYVFVLV